MRMFEKLQLTYHASFTTRMTDEERSHSALPNIFIFSDEQLMSICETSDVVACDCPVRLAGLLWEARTFYQHTMDCIDRCPEEISSHRSLGEKILQVDSLLSQILGEFLQEKGLLTDQQQINLRLLKQRQVQAILKQYDNRTLPDM